MISANELRIGNLVQDLDVQPFFFKIESIYKNNIGNYRVSYRNYSTHSDVEFLEPIPITEKWLLVFGFEYFESNDSYQLDSDLGFCIWGRIHYGFYIFANSEELGLEIRYVHELQNLYFTLTKQELELK